jgi:phosphoglycolate phosphatase
MNDDPLFGVRGVLFDVDDTLVLTARVGYKKCVVAAQRLLLKPPDERAFRAVYGQRDFADCVRYWHPELTDLTDYVAAYDSLAEEIPDVPAGDVVRVVAHLRTGGRRVGVLTNGPPNKTERKLRSVGLRAGSLDGIWHAGNVAFKKPDPRCFAPALASWGLAPNEVLFVGDAHTDEAAASAAGVRFLAVDTYGERGASGGTGRIGSLNELVR